MQAIPDPDGRRTEIVCAACDGCVLCGGVFTFESWSCANVRMLLLNSFRHMGHVFKGEGFKNPTDERHCVNSVSLVFHAGEAPLKE